MRQIAIVIVNWNKRQALAGLLDSLAAQDYLRYAVYVVDNASTDDSVAFLSAHYPAVQILRNADNLGGSGGFNTGLRAVLEEDYEFVWLLDNDAQVKAGALESLLAGMAQDARVAVVGSKILHADNPGIVSEIGARIHLRTLFVLPEYQNTPDSEVPPGQFIEVDYVAACSLLARVSAVREVGLWEQDFFLLWDDMEWCVRFRKHGYRVLASTDSSVLHRGFSERELTPAFIYYNFRNHLYFADKTYSGWRRAYFILWLCAVLNYSKRMYCAAAQQAYQQAAEYAIRDFAHGIQGRNPHELPGPPARMSGVLADYAQDKTVIFSAAACPAVTLKILAADLKQAGNLVYLIIPPDRARLFSWHPPERIIQGKPGREHTRTGALFVKFAAEKTAAWHYDIADTILILDNNGAPLEILRRPYLLRKLYKTGLRIAQAYALCAGALRALPLIFRERMYQ